MSLLEIALKLLLAVGLGGLIGLERESSHKPAGFRTNILICVGSAMMMIVSALILQGKEGVAGDLTRIATGVITGIGFIGAGAIIQARGSVTGLTTAATLWAVGGLGLVIGAGHYIPALIFTGIIILTLIIFRQIESQYMRKTIYRYHLKTKYSKDVLIHIKKLALHEGIRIRELTLKKEEDLSIADFAFSCTDEKEQKFNEGLLELEDILEIKIV